MNKNTNPELQSITHMLTISSRKQLEVRGVDEICAFDESEVRLKTSCGRLRIGGKGLRVTSLAPGESVALVEGVIDSVSYSANRPHTSVLKKIFS